MIASRSVDRRTGPRPGREGRARGPAAARTPAGRARTSKRRPTVETARGAQSGRVWTPARSASVAQPSHLRLTSLGLARQDRSRSRSRQHAPRTARHAVRQRGQRARRRIPRRRIPIRPDWADDSARCGRLAAGSHVACGAVWCVCTACRRGALRR